MAFTLDVSAEPAGELRRVLWEQAYHALRALRDDDVFSGIHRARKATRRARATLRLARSALTDEQYRSLKVGFRDIARALSPIRDADAIYRLAKELKYPLPLPPKQDEALQRADASRERLQRLLAQIELESLDISRDALVKGFSRGYRVARRRMVIARADPSDLNLHSWRKAVKVHRHHLQLFAAIWPPLFAAFISEAEQLQRDLGRQRDLALLADTLGALRPEHVEEQAACVTASFSRGAPLFAAQDRLVGAWLRAQWGLQP